MMATRPESEGSKPASTGTDGVADLERRLADLGGAATTPSSDQASSTLGFAMPPAQQQQAPKPAVMAGGKNKVDLLARITAAQERAKKVQPKAPPPAATTIAAAAAPPSTTTDAAPATDAHDFDLLGFGVPTASAPAPTPNTSAPPSQLDQFGLPTSSNEDLLSGPSADDTKPSASFQWDPHAPAPTSAESPSAQQLIPNTTIESSFTQQQQEEDQQKKDEEEAIAAILALEGLSSAEKEAMIADQRKIMASIEMKKANTQVSAADAFEQRSLSAAVGANQHTLRLHGQEKTKEAIKDGTALVIQCTKCKNWMQVTGDAQLMFCPACSTVSPVKENTGGMTQSEMEQLEADAKLAEQLQKEEYDHAEREQRQRQQQQRQRNAGSQQGGSQQDQGWMEWLGFGTPAAAPAVAARRERDRLIESSSNDGPAVASQQPLFACVADSIAQAANYAMSSVSQDSEGNVHGVDSSGLLNGGGRNNGNMGGSGGGYAPPR